MEARRRLWLLTVLAFVGCLPAAFFVGITLIGHARVLPYASVWLDRLVLVAATVGLPALAATVLHRLLVRKPRDPEGP